MKTEEYINKIIEETGLSKKEIEDLVEAKKGELKGLISEEGALFVIAKELGIDVSSANKNLLNDFELSVSDLTVNMKNIILVGRVKEIYRIIKFEKNGGELGMVGSFLLHDESGDVRIVLWDDNVKVLNDERFKINEVVKVINGYAKEGKYENIEVHVGKLSKVEVAPEDVDYKKFPKITEKYINISDIKESIYSVSIEGKISNLFPIKEFTKKDGQNGKLKSLILRDATGTIRVSFWNNDIDKLKDLGVGDYLSISNLNVRKNSYGVNSFDLHATAQSNLTKKDKILEFKAEMVDKIKDLQDLDNIVSFQGVITSIDDIKKVHSKSGEEISLLNFNITDNTGSIRVNAWRDFANDLANVLKINDGVYLKNVLIKYNDFSKLKEVSLISDSEIQKKDLNFPSLKIQDSISKLNAKKFKNNFTSINSIQSPGFFEIKGFLTKELNKIRLYEACSECNKKYENCICEEKGKKTARMIINQTFEDETGRIRVTFIGDIAEKLIGMKADKVQELIETPDYEDFLSKISSEIIGRDLRLKGRAKFSDFSNTYEILVSDFQEIDVEEELDLIINEIGN
ncbi:MAG: DUF2240 family protein [Candidatus Thorarchaeota archaeon]